MFKTELSVQPDIKTCSKSLKYNLLRQKLFLKYIKDCGILVEPWYGRQSKYLSVIEETEIPALSLGRVAIEERLGIPWYIVSPSYIPNNIFGLKGANGHLIVTGEGTIALGFVLKDYCNEYSLDKISPHRHLDGFYGGFYGDLQRKLIIVQGQPECAFNLVNSEIDTVFGDVFDPKDIEKRGFYEELYYYMHDYYKLNTGFEFGKDVVIMNKSTIKDGKMFNLIYCKKIYCKKERNLSETLVRRRYYRE